MNLLKDFERRRKELGMSRSTLARRSRVSLPTVNRILSGENSTANFANVVAIADALGMSLSAEERVAADDLRQRQARKKARRIVRLVQGTSALEGQGLGQAELEEMVSRTTAELLASKRRLWAD